MRSVSYKHRILAGACVVAMASAGHAATITWDAAASDVVYAIPTQVSTANTFVDSYTFNGDSTVNGVTFHGYNAGGSSGTQAIFNSSNIVVTYGAGAHDIYAGVAATDGNPTENAYAFLLSQELAMLGDNGSIQFGGLVNGSTYAIQLWQTPSAVAAPVKYSSSSDFTTGTSPTLYSAGGAGTFEGLWMSEFINGTFTATGTSQTVYFKTAGNTQEWIRLGAGQIRAVVPEPTGLALLGLGTLSLLTRRRRA